MTDDGITILLPVYGRSELLEPALESVLTQTSYNWHLLIADDGSDERTQRFLESWLAKHADERIHWMRRTKNLGLFANLNQAIEDAKTDWVLLLCSDDLLLPSAIRAIEALRQRWPEAGLVLSTFKSINADGTARPADSAWHHDQISAVTALIPEKQMLPALLQLGSVNGNLTGMAFSRSLWRRAGEFREDWRHAADWEWLCRAASEGPLVLNRKPIAKVRTHENQLSNSNRRSGHELYEVAAVVEQLCGHPLLASEPQRKRWAANVMQHQLWNELKQLLHQGPMRLVDGLRPIHRATGLRATGLALLRSAPRRLQKYLSPGGSDGKPLAD